jgi:hypothetical protein
MTANRKLKVVLIKPSKYARDGVVERFRAGFMPNSTLAHLRSLTLQAAGERGVEIRSIDECTATDTRYLDWLKPESCDLLAAVGVQSHQMHRALDLCALGRSNGVRCLVIGGPHVMTCDTSEVEGKGISFAYAEAELIWPQILEDAESGYLQDSYGAGQRWAEQLDPPVLIPASRGESGSYVIPMMGIYPARGCPYSCSFCSVVKIAGNAVRSQPVETTIRSLIAAKNAGVRLVMFTSDNFNKYAEVRQLLRAMIDEDIRIPFFAQCDVHLEKDEELVSLLARAGCVQVFVGVESFSRATLKSVRKFQNDPRAYGNFISLCHRYGVSTHFSNIIGFPEQDENSVMEHLSALRALRPFMASFYVLTPIPGTDQYEEFRAGGLIEETNLDRFDATCSVWRHPRISADRLGQLITQCYSEFYATLDVLKKVSMHRWNATQFVYALGLIYPAYARFVARRGMHPMAGGFLPVVRDRVRDYRELRRRVFGIEYLALPASRTMDNLVRVAIR